MSSRRKVERGAGETDLDDHRRVLARPCDSEEHSVDCGYYAFTILVQTVR
jgi:hypothetical protein